MLLYFKYLNIDSAKLYRGEDKRDEVQLTDAFEYERNEFLVFRTRNEVQPGKYIMAIGKHLVFLTVGP